MHSDAALVERFVAAELARADLYFFARHMFRQRRGFKWQRAPHHRLICDALMRVYRGECKRLIINIPPRYSKTELAVVMFIAWALGQVPDAEFIHTSYSATLTGENSANVRDLIQHEEYREIFPAAALAGEARSHWSTTAGGVMYSTGSGGSLTGFGAGKMRPGFGGCFPYGQLVETEIGPIAIGDLVTKRMPVRVWSWNEKTGRAELMPVDTFWTNPANEILEVGMPDGSAFRCTPNHRLLTAGGWVEASQLAKALDLVNAKAGFLRRLRAGLRRVYCKLNNAAGVLGLKGPCRIRQSGRYADPGLPQLDLPDDSRAYSVPCGDFSRRSIAGENLDDKFPAELCAGPALQHRECAVREGVLHVVGLGAPRKIAARVVAAVAVKVPRLIRGRPTTRKSLKHQRGNVPRGDNSGDGQIDAKVSLAVVAGLQKPNGDGTPHSASVGDLIKPAGAGYLKPSFVRDAGHVDTTFCLEVRGNHNFILAQSGAIVSNCIIIDDPHKADEARSDTVRQGVIDWFQNTLESRKNDPENTPVILIMQRLHEKDLAGWLLAGGNGETWEHLCLSAWQDDGTPLWPEKHSADELRRMEKAAPYTFAGQYRQRPAPPEGMIFKPGMIETVDALPALPTQWARGWDFADSTKGDYTAGGKLGKLRDGRFVIGGMERERFTTDARDRLILTTAQRDGAHVRQSLPQDPGQAGKGQVLAMTRMLAGYPVKSSPETGDKVVRAEAFAAQVNVGNVVMLRGPWNEALVEELKLFPNGAFDDQVDALSRAFNELLGAVDPSPAGIQVRGL